MYSVYYIYGQLIAVALASLFIKTKKFFLDD